MRKNWMQMVTLCLCLVLLVLTMMQGNQLKEFREQTNEQMEILQSDVINTIQSNANSVIGMLYEAEELVAEYALEPNGIDKEKQMLKAVFSATLKEWYEDTEMTLLAGIGEDKHSLPMKAKGDGVYFSELLLPFDADCQLSFEVVITGGGLTQKENLNGWGRVERLLPLQRSGLTTVGTAYENGILSSGLYFGIAGADGENDVIKNTQFLTYRNGQLVQTQTAVGANHFNQEYTVGGEEHIWSTECDPGDVIEVRFRCEDKYGLGYDFWCQSWEVDKEGNVQQNFTGSNVGPSLELYWPQ